MKLACCLLRVNQKSSSSSSYDVRSKGRNKQTGAEMRIMKKDLNQEVHKAWKQETGKQRLGLNGHKRYTKQQGLNRT